MVDVPEHPELMRQVAPWPTELEYLVDRLRPRPGWTFTLHDRARESRVLPDGGHVVASGLTFQVDTANDDTYHPGVPRPMRHLFVVPAVVWSQKAWAGWLFDRICNVDRHEAAETFIVEIDTGPWRPMTVLHSRGDDPYRIYEPLDA